MNQWTIDVNEENFEAEVLERSTEVPVMVDFWAEWCGPCRRLAPTVDALASEFDGRATVAKLNVDENPNVPGRFAVRGIPTLLLFKGGQLAETIVGLRAKEDIAQMIERHLGD
jgi:thioredoxin 1